MAVNICKIITCLEAAPDLLDPNPQDSVPGPPPSLSQVLNAENAAGEGQVVCGRREVDA